MSTGGIKFEIFLMGDLAMQVIIDRRLQRDDISDCFQTLALALETAEKEDFQEYGIFNWEINGRLIQVTCTE